MDRQSGAWQCGARPGNARVGKARQGGFVALQGEARIGEAGQGEAWQEAKQGLKFVNYFDRLGEAWHGVARWGVVR